MEIDVKMIYFHFFSFSSFQFQFYNVGPALVVHYPSLKCSNRHHKLGQAHNIQRQLETFLCFVPLKTDEKNQASLTDF